MSRCFHVVAAAALVGALAGCAAQTQPKPMELVDERTGISVAALQSPIELMQGEMLVLGKRTSFAFLGPVEWDRMGVIRYGLWLHVAPGNDRPLADIRGPAAVSLILDDGPLALSPIEPPALGKEPYKPAVPWGQTAYFDLTAHDLRRMAASGRLTVQCRAVDGSNVAFQAIGDTRPILGPYVQSRDLTGD